MVIGRGGPLRLEDAVPLPRCMQHRCHVPLQTSVHTDSSVNDCVICEFLDVHLKKLPKRGIESLQLTSASVRKYGVFHPLNGTF